MCTFNMLQRMVTGGRGKPGVTVRRTAVAARRQGPGDVWNRSGMDNQDVLVHIQKRQNVTGRHALVCWFNRYFIQ